MTEETCLGEVAGSGHTAGLEGLIKGSELPGMGRVGLRQGLWLGVLAQEGVDVLNININKIKMKDSTRGIETNGEEDKQNLNTKKVSHSSKQPCPPPPSSKKGQQLCPRGHWVTHQLHACYTADMGWA